MLSRIELLKIFVAAANSESFKESAIKLDSTPQKISRAIKELENQLGELLFYRSTRMIKITEFGKVIVSDAKRVIDDVDKLFESSKKNNNHDHLTGIVKISAPVFIGRNYLYDAVSNIINKNPELSIEITLSDSIDNFVQNEIDIGVRVGTIDNGGYIVRKINESGFSLVASPFLAKKIGRIETVEQLSNIPVVMMKDMSTGTHKNWIGDSYRKLKYNNIKLTTNDPDVISKAIRDGIGIGQIPSILADEYVKRGEMVLLSDQENTNKLDIYIYRPQSGPVPQRIRYVFDELIKIMGRKIS